jgi:16S rRNA (uracil1498-N3)-methyltransferase
MSDRFYIPTPIIEDRISLTGSESHHLAHVMRAEVGQCVTLFDGSGQEFVAEIQAISKREVRLTVRQRREINREAPVKVALAVALPKGERQQWLVEKVVELGVAELIPLETKRGVAQPSEGALERLKRTVIEASKQCGRNQLMQIAAPQTWSQFVAAPHENNLRLVAHPGGMPLHDKHLQHTGTGTQQGLLAAIGPEGGFTDDEISQAVAAGWQIVDLGPRILRVETAAIALAAWAIYSR